MQRSCQIDWHWSKRTGHPKHPALRQLTQVDHDHRHASSEREVIHRPRSLSCWIRRKMTSYLSQKTSSHCQSSNQSLSYQSCCLMSCLTNFLMRSQKSWSSYHLSYHSMTSCQMRNCLSCYPSYCCQKSQMTTQNHYSHLRMSHHDESVSICGGGA